MRKLLHRPCRTLCLITVAIAAIAIGACQGDRTPKISNVVLVTLDTLRADHLGCYGYPRTTSPFINDLAARGVRFEHAFSAMSTTVPSHASIMTSLYPVQIGVLKNGHRLGESVPTLAEQFAGAGFRTAAFVSTDRHFVAGGLSRGFDHFSEPVKERFYRDAAATVDEALAWLVSQDDTDKQLLWIHLFDPHSPYRSDPDLLAEIRAEDPDGPEGLKEFFLQKHRVNAEAFAGDEVGLLELMDSYDTEIRYLDSQLARLYEEMESHGLNKNSLWVLVADHGEGLGNHRWLGHGKNIYNEQIRVPLLFHTPSGDIEPGVVPDLVETVDIFPTLIEMAQVENSSQPVVEGQSLLPLLTGARSGYRKRTAFSQRRAFSPLSGEADTELDQLNYEAGEKFALQDLRHKYIYHSEGPDEFFVTERDPHESRNLVEGSHPEEEKFRDELLRRLARMHDAADLPADVDPATIEKLRTLGYIQ